MNKIYEIKFGSHLYGTDTENSDLDFKAIYLPTAREICLNSYKKTITTSRPKKEFERNTKDDVDVEIFSLDRYLTLLCEGQTVALDMLFAGENALVHSLDYYGMFWEIYKNKEKLIHKDINAFIGYAKQQAARYGVKGFRVSALRTTLEWLNNINNVYLKLKDCDVEKFVSNAKNEHIKITECKGPNGLMLPHLEVCNRKIPFHALVKYAKEVFQRLFDEYGQRALLAEKNEGIDWKALSHAVRVNNEAVELLLTGNITFPRPEKALLLKIKKGEMQYKEVETIIERGLEELKVANEKSTLREKPDTEWVDNYIYDVYSRIVRETL